MAVAQSEVRDAVEAKYRSRTTKSLELFDRARTVMPGGDTRSALYFPPYPTFIERGFGCRLKDVDGNEYLDFLSNYTSLVHGHAHPVITGAISEQIGRGIAFAGPTESQIRLAELLKSRMPSLEQVRFCNSGTEATLMAIRAAKAFTGRDKVIKLDGGYHGTHDAAVIGTPTTSNAKGAVQALGLFRGIITDVLSAPANDIDAAARIFDQCRDELAAVIVEPVMGGAGIIPLDAEFLNFLQARARSSGALLILDEVITFRLAYGGAQQLYSVRPDLTTLGKIIGGGLPVGAFGGRSDVMSQFDPADGKLPHSGTFNGNAPTMAAGIAALELLTKEAIDRINRLGDRLRTGLQRAIRGNGIEAQITGIGSLLGIHFTEEPIRNYRDALFAPRNILALLHLSLMNRGMFTAPRGFLCISTAMSESEIDEFASAFGDTLDTFSPDLCRT